MPKLKECLYCNRTFSRIEFPQTFKRMVTCGSAECAAQRRYYMWKKRTRK